MDMEMSSRTCNQSMLWNWYTIDSCFIAESWHVGSNGAFAATCIGTVLLVMVMEALRRLGREFDDWILRSFQAGAAAATSLDLSFLTPDPLAQHQKNDDGSTKAASKTTITATGQMQASRAVMFRASPLQQAIRAIIHAMSLGVAYLVMLLVMSYNGYVIICVIIGGGLGKFFCDWMTRRIIVKSEGMKIGSDEEENTAVGGIEEPSVCCG
ncbi:hypothetical protein M406DRAFT_75399 [Cryphonectria parasitica EP155]|uniref:Copper transport protein n=1 Tax=Cryphonectria parasitica (strain ATCC 38755 / EP155) TaxID=660469 RepID=A0A9P4XSI3_CRYP1|nr:uncharacterized protein M406DRAFT_75399 [Cryphonectria parasitica EP155]KAF3760032.1 hypothetical protein M406DRAFT_75399 [Cryphonectria parasitica EP155]